MNRENHIPLASRIKELLIDWLVICAYLAGLFMISAVIYWLTFQGFPQFSQTVSQIIATVTSVIPIIFFFAILDFHGGSIGKRKADLSLYFSVKKFRYSLLRNAVKFLPWQIGHMGTIRGMYTDFDIVSILLQNLAIVLLITFFLMGTLRKDKRHPGDLLAGTQVQASRIGHPSASE